ncbi:hypothetical protein Pla163_00190 [Planctomycetes bacterium Pla163]|uniref:Uncharacterized protein n=1 Tax=Rohdeia mirabilis TaxID=2528008 RepID=A0A518CUM5_9BACT|nr:hypothetical protein Pla163_00190 [Planctomycetes bacterium Pla163]
MDTTGDPNFALRPETTWDWRGPLRVQDEGRAGEVPRDEIRAATERTSSELGYERRSDGNADILVRATVDVTA